VQANLRVSHARKPHDSDQESSMQLVEINKYADSTETNWKKHAASVVCTILSRCQRHNPFSPPHHASSRIGVRIACEILRDAGTECLVTA
jgi:hypothetical protein